MESLNFTQFCEKNGYPDDYDTMINAQLLGGRGLDGNISKRTIKKQDIAFIEMQTKNKEAHNSFYNAVKNGLIKDSSCKLSMESILKKENEILISKLNNEIKILQSHIDRIVNLGSMSHLKNGVLKKGYQLAVNQYQNKINELKTKYPL